MNVYRIKGAESDLERVYEQLLGVRQSKGAGFIVLIDPDKLRPDQTERFVQRCVESGVDAFFIGGSLIHSGEVNACVDRVKAASSLPVIGFPGALNQIAPSLDAVLFLSVISSRNPEYLFGQHVSAAPLIKRLGIEPISTGYMLVESGHCTTAQYMTHSLPLPRNKPEVAAATALAAEMMGMQLVFTDGGSGADDPVPADLIAAISTECAIPLVVGGGLRTTDDVSRCVRSGASFVVVGNAIEDRPDPAYIADLAAAAHDLTPAPFRS